MRTWSTSRPLRGYLTATLALGTVAAWASENLFWSSVSPDPVHVAREFGVVLVAYSIVAAAALTLVVRAGAQGWRAAFLGGALLGFGIEGVVVGELYVAFPWQVVWTPLAWHGLVTGLAVVGLARSAGHRTGMRQALAWLALGLGAGAWAMFWPGERTVSPLGAAVTLLLPALLLPLANLALDRVALIDRARLPWWAWVAPALLVVGWLARLVASGFALPLFVWPVAVAATYAVARRHGDPTAPGLWLGDPAALRRHLLVLIAPATAAVVAGLGWAGDLRPPTGELVYAATSLASVALLARLALRRPRPRQPALTAGT